MTDPGMGAFHKAPGQRGILGGGLRGGPGRLTLDNIYTNINPRDALSFSERTGLRSRAHATLQVFRKPGNCGSFSEIGRFDEIRVQLTQGCGGQVVHVCS